MNTVKDLLTEKEMEEYDTIGFPGNVKVLHDALLEKLKADQDYEVWVPIRYYSYGIRDENDNLIHLKTSYQLISNKGNIRNTKKNFDYKQSMSNNYKRWTLTLETKPMRFRTHRIVATCFVPRKEPYCDTPYNELEVNHLDTVTINNDFRNLEWCPSIHNIKHAINAGLIIPKPILGVVDIPGEFFGFKMVFDSLEQTKKLFGTDHRKEITLSSLQGHKAKGCYWYLATSEDVDRYAERLIPEDLLSLLRVHNSRKRFKVKAICIADGREFFINGEKEMIQHGFNSKRVYDCCAGIRRTHKGHTFSKVEADDTPP